jgi:ATP-dependent Clp endopeptidase proteolytic subunit ClpP
MVLKYTIDASVDEPIMLIDKHIGFDSEDGQGIDGAEFARELLYLDSLGKKSIQIRINSVGGSVMDGMSIYNAILKTNAKVDTVNVGIAASIAAVIFQAGRKRIMSDYALLMIHNPMGGDKKMLKLMKESLITMLTRKTNKSEADISKLMDATTWFTATECLTNGLCDEIEQSISLNKPRIMAENAKNAYKEAQLIINSFNNQNTNQMLKVTNKLGLDENANEELILNAIESIENKSKNDLDAMKEKCAKLEADLSDAKQKVAEMEKAKNEAEAEAEAKAQEDCKNKAIELVTNAVKLGKIVNKDEVIEKWTNLAITDFDTANTMIDGLAVNKSGNVLNVDDNGESKLGSAVASAMIEIRNKLEL